MWAPGVEPWALAWQQALAFGPSSSLTLRHLAVAFLFSLTEIRDKVNVSKFLFIFTFLLPPPSCPAVRIPNDS